MTVSGYKFFDANDNGVKDSEPVLDRWEIELYKDGSFYGSDTTGTIDEGYYEILIMDPGIYTVTENLLADFWIRTNVRARAPRLL